MKTLKLFLFFFIITSRAALMAQTDQIDIKVAKEIAWIGDNQVKGPIKGVILTFHGLGASEVKSEANEEELVWANNGYLVIYPYYGPWGWMNRQARDMVNQIVEAVYAEYNLPDTTPLLAYGGSMGGFSAILYSRYAKHPVTACIANCPVTDIKFHFSERVDLPRTFRVAYWGYDDKTFEERMAEHNPMDQVEYMPDIPYFIMHITGDPAVNKKIHSDRFVAKMRENGKNVTYKEIEGEGHCGPIPDDVHVEKENFILGFLSGGC
ncbi:MAG: prolyl oligopeptidase family serine peptidase [Candidatus Symbiothrix sp.]|jgi:dipeptidyl aminopeptidase/acylaminoacyl peptidase|nr:prolyl oligopeptidase family serine peptidase [Candidatus Symbiothrix sp.]